MRIADRHLAYHETGCVLRLKLLEFLLQPRFLHRIFVHPNGEVTAMIPDGTRFYLFLISTFRITNLSISRYQTRLILLREFNMVLARPWPATPVNLHPIDVWSSFPHGGCDITGCLERVLTTNGNNLPPRHEFYHNRMRGIFIRRAARHMKSIFSFI